MNVQIGVYVCILLVWSFVRIQALRKKQQKKEAAVYGSLMGVSAVIGSLLMAKVDIPSFVLPYIIVFRPIGQMILKQ
ncbi:hypothetical protein [Paenibacillus andongensis]|uniref:hypothetical protein n=1 Tax=Paenibacillus andongensis TaxID=2975482 RepID=UPI0021BB896A|nr:hypothetical protein [Paenibacillus andongensis]